MPGVEALTTSNYVLSACVLLHIAAELYHYVSQWIKERRDKKMLEHIDDHLDNMKCTKCKKEQDDST